MVCGTKDRVRFLGRCCLLLSDFRSRTANEFYIPARPKGFTRRDYLRLGPSIEFASPSEGIAGKRERKKRERKRGKERKKKGRKKKEFWLNRDVNNTSRFPEGCLKIFKKIIKMFIFCSLCPSTIYYIIHVAIS